MGLLVVILVLLWALTAFVVPIGDAAYLFLAVAVAIVLVRIIEGRKL